MHKYVKNVLMEYVKNNYSCPEEFSLRDLEELKLWGCTMSTLLEADEKYHSIVEMESTK